MDRNVILAVVLSAAVLFGWEMTIGAQQREALQAQQAARQAIEEAAAANGAAGATTGQGSVPGAPANDLIGIAGNPAVQPEIVDLDAALASAPGRIPIDTEALSGSINLTAARIDDLSLKNYREDVDPESPMIRLLSPRAAQHGHYVEQGWVTDGATTQNVVWTAPQGATLTVATPVTLTARMGDIVVERVLSVDDKFMFEVKDTVRNEGESAAALTPYGLVVQRGIPEDFANFMILHEGPIAIIDNGLFERKYKKARTAIVEKSGERGWVGITNKYWLAAAIPPQGQPFDVDMRNVGSVDEPIFRASYFTGAQEIAPGASVTYTSHLFGGAKDVDTLQAYEKPVDKGGLGVWDFDKAVDWGNFFILTRPIFFVMNYFGNLTGSFGIAILLLTLIIKALLFPLANKAYESMSKMKKLQPEIEKLRARYPDDKMKMQQEMMALYQKEKMNPMAGCVPILLQMPIFYALYKTLFVTIELRHAPFLGYIKDLSAPDPTSIFNLFGLLPFDPTALPLIGAVLGIGVLPLMMGVAMWFQTKLNPPAADPMQQQIFNLMPIMFTFLFASFAAGLVLYWFWNTFLSILQQWVIMKKNGVTIDWGERLPFIGGPKKAVDVIPPSKK